MFAKQKVSVKSSGKYGSISKTDKVARTDKELAKKQSVSKSTILMWTKNRALYCAAKQQTSIKAEKLRDNDCDRLDHVVFRSFLYQRSQNIPINNNFIKGKALQFAKKLSFNELQASDGWLCRWE